MLQLSLTNLPLFSSQILFATIVFFKVLLNSILQNSFEYLYGVKLSMGEAKRRRMKDPNYGQIRSKISMSDETVNHLLRYVNQEKAEIEDIAFLELCEDVVALLEYADGKEKAIAFAIVDKYGQAGVIGINRTHYEYVDLAIQSKRNEEFSESIYYYNEFFKNSSVGKAWFMTYYGLAKVLTLAGKYDLALVAINISIELSLMTQCADAEYIHHKHYLNILHLSNGFSNTQYLLEISGLYQ